MSFDRPQPQAARGLEATLKDQDTPVSDERWQWARSEDGETWNDIEGATAASRNPSADDVGNYLRATVTYADSFDAGKSVSAVTTSKVEARTVANAAPSFAGQDDNKGTRNYVDVARSVSENSPVGSGVGKSVSASDADSDVLIYSLDDTPDLKDEDGVARFTIDSSSGQIKVGKELGADNPSATIQRRRTMDSTGLRDVDDRP